MRQRRHSATRDGPRTSEPRRVEHGLLALQRGAGNAAVARWLARVGGWKGVGSKSPNAGEMTVTEKTTGHSARRIPIDGIPEGNQTSDLDDVTSEEKKDKGLPTEHVVKHTVRERTSESAGGGKAIVVIPTALTLSKATSVDVLLHLHGHTTGYRKSGATTRDLGVERIEEQVAAAAGTQRPLIGVLPQGRFKSSFGKAGKSFDPTAYLDSVWRILGDIGAWNKDDAPTRGGLILSSHSGGDAALEDMLVKGQAAGTGPVASLKALFLLDTMYGPRDAEKVIKFVRFRLAHDLAHLSEMQAAGLSEKQQLDWVQAHGFRLRGAHSGGHYKPQMKLLADAIGAWLAEAKLSSALSAAFAKNLVIDPPGGSGVNHDAFVGEADHLRKALELLP